MHRLLIADTAQAFALAIKKQLKNDFFIETCEDGEHTLKLIQSFEPDILLLDLTIPMVDGLSVLSSLRNAGAATKVIVTTCYADPYVMARLRELQVQYVFLKPCRIGAVLSRICDISFGLQNPDKDAWDVENEIDRILLDMGFRMGVARYKCVRDAVLLKYRGLDGSVTKCLYPEVAKRHSGNGGQVEKAIRDAIRDARKNGSRSVWNLYFPAEVDYCPSNEIFIARIAHALKQRTRLKKPCELQLENAQ